MPGFDLRAHHGIGLCRYLCGHSANFLMKTPPLLKFAIAFCALATSLVSADSKPLEASVKELLLLSDSPKMLEMSKAQLAGLAGSSIQQALQGKSLTPEIRKIVEAGNAKTLAMLTEGLKWEAFEPTFIETYQSLLTQEEVDGIVAFYKTPAGKAMVQKMPDLMQASGQRIQQTLAPMMQQLQQVQQETMLQLQVEFAKQN